MQSNRREFLIETAAAAAALGFASRSARAQTSAGPNERINMGFIGLGGMGSGRLEQFMEHPDVNVTALCDVDESHLRNAVGMVDRKRGTRPPTFHDFRKLLEQKDVDAVCVATPDHWHALPTILACKAGKDVFCEKPLCYSIGEGRAMVTAAAANKRITQLGNHIHNDYPNYRRAVELVRSGLLGKIDRVSCWIQSENKGMGRPPDGTPPKELDYAFWLGPAPKRPYNPNRSHGTFRYFWDYSGGVFADFWCHITDVAYWALDLQAPTSVVTLGNRNLDDNGETPNQMEVVYEYSNGPDADVDRWPQRFPGVRRPQHRLPVPGLGGDAVGGLHQPETVRQRQTRNGFPASGSVHPGLARAPSRVSRFHQVAQANHLQRGVCAPLDQRRLAREHCIPHRAAIALGRCKGAHPRRFGGAAFGDPALPETLEAYVIRP